MIKFLVKILVVLFFFALIVAFIAYSRGYRFDRHTRSIVPTGIIAVTSSPKASQIFINGKFKGATDTNLTLPPGDYSVEVKKEGYITFTKKITLKGEIVESVNALLFPINPSLSPLTNLGVIKALQIGQGSTILVFVQSGDQDRDGIYIFDGARNNLSIFSPLKTIILKKNLPVGIDLATTNVYFAPDYKQGLFEFTFEDGRSSSYLLSLSEENKDLFDITQSKNRLIQAWIDQKEEELSKVLETYPKEIQKIATDSLRIISFSPDETKVIYEAEKPATIPLVIKPALIASNQTPEERKLTRGKLYIYDRKEDKNYPVDINAERIDSILTIDKNLEAELTSPEAGDTSNIPGVTGVPVLNQLRKKRPPRKQRLQEYLIINLNLPLAWYPDSRHVVINEDVNEEAKETKNIVKTLSTTPSPTPANVNKHITIANYDGQNRQAVYSGPYESGFFAITSNGKILILANLNPQVNKLPDIYAVGLQ